MFNFKFTVKNWTTRHPEEIYQSEKSLLPWWWHIWTAHFLKTLQIIAAFAYLYYALKVCTFLWRKSTYFRVCSRIAGKLWDILLHHYYVFNRWSVASLCTFCHRLNCTVSHLVKANIHISVNREIRSTLICQSRVYHAENSLHVFE